MSSPKKSVNLPKDTPLLPRRAHEERPLFIILTAMAFLAGLTLLMFLIGLRASQSWQTDLSRTLTVQILHDGSQSIDVMSSQARDIVQNTLPGSQVEIMSERESRELLSPWIGNVDLPEDIAIPIILKITQRPDSGIVTPELETALTAQGLTVEIDDHTRWSANIRRTWRAVQVGMAAIITIVLASSAAIAAYATQSVLRVRHNIISVLAHVGAPDRFVVGLFVRRFLTLGLTAALTGGVGALLFLIIFAAATKSYAVDILPVTGLRLPDIAALFILILAMGLISAVTAGWTTVSKLQRDRRRS